MDLGFNTSASGYDRQNAMSCAAASRMAYTETPTIATRLNHVLILECASARVISFRGTAEIRDWVTDAEAFFCKTPEGRVHYGFQLAHKEAFEPILDYLADHPRQDPLFITGHSLGGAQAVLCARRLSLPAQIYTFGQPRVGNREFVEGCNSKFRNPQSALPIHHRIINEEDIIARLPAWLAGFRHSGECVFFPSIGGGPRFNPPVWQMLISDLWGTYRDWKNGQIAQLADHHMDRYLQRLA